MQRIMNVNTCVCNIAMTCWIYLNEEVTVHDPTHWLQAAVPCVLPTAAQQHPTTGYIMLWWLWLLGSVPTHTAVVAFTVGTFTSPYCSTAEISHWRVTMTAQRCCRTTTF